MAAINTNDLANRIVSPSAFGVARSQQAVPADNKDSKTGKAIGQSNEAKASLCNEAEELPKRVDPGMDEDQGYNIGGLYELMGVITHQGKSADSGHYCSYIKKEGEGDLWSYFHEQNVEEVPSQMVNNLAAGGKLPLLVVTFSL